LLPIWALMPLHSVSYLAGCGYKILVQAKILQQL
jgi:hypothetical protein